jgi:hypothetical protein
MNTYSISQIIADAAATNNNRLIGFAMTEPQKRAAEKAVARGLMTTYHMNFPGYGMVPAYSLIK